MWPFLEPNDLLLLIKIVQQETKSDIMSGIIEQHYFRKAATLFAGGMILMLLQNFISDPAFANSKWQIGTGSGYLFNDNYFKTDSNKVSDQTFKITPSASISIQQFRSVLDFGYSGIYGLNETQTQDDQFNHNVHFGFKLKLGDFSGFDFSAAYLTSRDERGVSASPVVSTAALAKWSGKKTSATFTLPLIGKSLIRIGGKYEERNYETSYAGSSRNIVDLNIASILPVTVKTAFQIKYLLQITTPHLSASNAAQLDQLSVGVKWRTTGKTTSFANVGYEINTSNINNTRYSGIYTDINFLWHRKTYSTVNFKLSRKTTDNANVVEGYLVSNIASMIWKHQYTDKWASDIGTSVMYDEYELGRKDVYVNPLLGFSLKQSRMLQYNFKLLVSKRSSNQSALDYDNIIVSAGFNMRLGGR